MAKFIDEKSTYLREQIGTYRKRILLLTLLAVACLAMLGAVFLNILGVDTYPFSDIYIWIAGAVGLIGFFPAIYYARESHVLARRYKRGNLGEEAVEKVLAGLPDTWSVFSNVVMPFGGNIDFIVVGNEVAFVLEVKHTYGDIGYDGGRLLVNGKRIPGKDILTQAARQKKFIKDFITKNLHIKPRVEYLLVFSNPESTVHHSTRFIKNPDIIHIKELQNHILTNG
ncbi:MAG TPA: nuclease-related domain-containing protein [Patescibacteria group bacterium]|nr:nuclease-related domain-containing protein [Patescibacteria group bacterium]